MVEELRWDNILLFAQLSLSHSLPTLDDYLGNHALTRDLARRYNDYSVNLVHTSPQRFGAFAVLPLPDMDAALLELEYALDTLHLDGVILMSSYEGQYLTDVFAIIGLSGIALFLNAYKKPLLWVGIVMNLFGIAYLLWKIR